MGERNKITRARVIKPPRHVKVMGRFTFWRDMKHDWVKIPLMAKELGVSVKTIYNWISVGKLFMPRPGYVSQLDSYEVWLEQRQLRSMYSSFLAVQGTKRATNGQFQKKDNGVEQSGAE